MSHKNDSPNLTQKVYWSIKGLVVNLFVISIAASADQPSIIAVLFFTPNKNFRFTLVHGLFHILPEIFDFSGLVSLFAHSTESALRQQLRSKAIQNKLSQYRKTKSEIEAG